MSNFNLVKETSIKVYSYGKVVSGIGKHPKWSLGLWMLPTERAVWGLLHYGYPTYMCYGFDYSMSIAKHVAHNRSMLAAQPDRPEWGFWFFDVGNELAVHLDDLEVAAKTLGIWDRDDRKIDV